MAGTLLTTVEVAERLGLSSWAIAQAVRTGALEPSARTNDDFLFTERAVAAFAELQAQAAAAPLQPPEPGSRSEWSGDVDRLNVWLKDLTEALPISAAETVVSAPAAPVPAAARGSILQRIAAGQAAAAASPPAAAPIAAPTATEPIVAEPIAAPPAVEPVPAAAVTEPISAAPEPGGQLPEPEPVAPLPEPIAPASEATPVAAPQPVAAAPAPAPVPIPVQTAFADPFPALSEAVSRPPAGPGPDLSRQAVLVVQPIVRFRVLRDVTDRLATIHGIAEARLERLEAGVASYRISFEGERPSDEAIGEALAALNLEVMLVDSVL
jgi:hypothetical protein